jgi:hypothetical protein
MVTFNCTDYKKTVCQFYLLLNDNGTMGLYKGIEPSTSSTGSAIWLVGGSNTKLEPNPNWTAAKGKLGRNYLKMNETLVKNDWIGSPNGTIRLLMQSDGNLVLQTSKTAPSCIGAGAGNKYGVTDVNAIYQVNEYSNTNKSAINKFAFIDADLNLREYPSSMIEMSNNYTSYTSYDSPGNDIGTSVINSIKGCEIACNNSINKPCNGYVYNNNTNTCSLKGGSTKSIIKSKQITPEKNVVLGLRTPRVKPNLVNTCGKNVSYIDTIRYQKYIKGSDMNTNVGCSTTPELNPDFKLVNAVSTQVSSVASAIVGNINNLGNTIMGNNNQMANNREQIERDINSYNNNKNDISIILQDGFQNLKLNLNSNIRIGKEGMTNLDQQLDMNDIDHMLNDSDIRILQANYSYILWSVLAVGILSVTVNTINK